MTNNILDEEIEFPLPCPECGQEIRKTVAWLNQNRFFRCPSCGEALSTRNKQTQALLDSFAIAQIGLALASKKSSWLLICRERASITNNKLTHRLTLLVPYGSDLLRWRPILGTFCLARAILMRLMRCRQERPHHVLEFRVFCRIRDF